jgi:hypothetical protein
VIPLWLNIYGNGRYESVPFLLNQVQDAFLNRNFSEVGWGDPLEAQNVLAVRFKLVQPIFLFELSEGSSHQVLKVLLGERAQLVLGGNSGDNALFPFLTLLLPALLAS